MANVGKVTKTGKSTATKPKATKPVRIHSDLDATNFIDSQIDKLISSLEFTPTSNAIDTIIEDILRLKRKLTKLGSREVPPELANEVITELQKLTATIHKTRKNHEKVTGGYINRLGNAIDEYFIPNPDETLDLMGIDPTRFLKTDREKKAMSKAIYESFLREGQFEVAASFKAEALTDETLEDNFDPVAMLQMKEVYEAYVAFANKNEEPALKLISKYAQLLDLTASPLPFMVHKVAFMQLVKADKPVEAINFARANFKLDFSERYPEDFRHLMGTVMLRMDGEGLDGLKAIYGDYFNDSIWDGGREIFLEEALYALGACRLTPFPVIFEAGSKALTQVGSNPALYRTVRSNWDTMQLMLYRHGGSTHGEFYDRSEFGPDACGDPIFHSRFICPITREEVKVVRPYCGPTGWLYPCGHVFSLKAMLEIQNRADNVMTYKCPICLRTFGSLSNGRDRTRSCPIRSIVF